MGNIHTHYDNLKVTRNAPPEIIRAAYKTLSQKYHPDKNINKPDATRVMSIINTSYEILADPQKRADHDAWILKKENELRNIENSNKRDEPSKESAQHPSKEPFKYYQPPPGYKADQSFYGSKVKASSPKSDGYKFFYHLGRYWYVYFFLMLVGIALSTNSENRTHTPESSPYAQQRQRIASAPTATPSVAAPTAPPVKDAYVRANNAPNGAMWPSRAGYLYGYAVGNKQGLSNLTIDNTRNSSDVHLKLYDLNHTDARSVREIFLPAFTKFTMENINAGIYDVRYMDLPTGVLSKSENFDLSERETSSGREYSNMTLTLYKVQGGNMKTHKINQLDF